MLKSRGDRQENVKTWRRRTPAIRLRLSWLSSLPPACATAHHHLGPALTDHLPARGRAAAPYGVLRQSVVLLVSSVVLEAPRAPPGTPEMSDSSALYHGVQDPSPCVKLAPSSTCTTRARPEARSASRAPCSAYIGTYCVDLLLGARRTGLAAYTHVHAVHSVLSRTEGRRTSTVLRAYSVQT